MADSYPFTLSLINGWTTPISSIQLAFSSDGNLEPVPGIPGPIQVGECVAISLTKYSGSDRYSLTFVDGSGTQYSTSSSAKIVLDESIGVALMKPDGLQKEVLTWDQSGDDKATATLSAN